MNDLGFDLLDRRAIGAGDAIDRMQDQDLLELLLRQSGNVTDPQAIAKTLLQAFGDFAGVIAAPSARLKGFCDIGVLAQLKLVEVAAQRLARAKMMNRPILSDWQALLDYCQVRMAHLEVEQLRVIYLNRKNAVITDVLQAQGTVDHTPVYPRDIVKGALDWNASAVILAHNHPSGDPSPSAEDITMTKAVARACDVLGIAFHDHLIIGKGRHMSFRAEGLL